MREERGGSERRHGAVYRFARLLTLACLSCAALAAAMAAQETYDYDALGRLVRVIDEQGRVTQYVYDAAGNILQVITGGTAQAPTVAAITPASVTRGDSAQVVITGTGLVNSEVTTSAAGLSIGAVQSSDTQVTFSLAVALSAALGPQAITLSNAAGTAGASITINPVLPKLGVAPQPVAVPPDGTAHNFLVTLSVADTVDHTVSVQSANTALATVSPATITILAGQTQATISVSGKATGTTSIALSSTGLASTAAPVFVATDFTGISTRFAASVGVLVRNTATPSNSVGPLLTRPVGIAKGPTIDTVSPGALAIGTGPTTVVVTGRELSGVSAAALSAPDGLTVGAVSAAPDGSSVSFPVTVSGTAATTSRRIVFSGTQQPYLPARAGADQILVTLPPPQILSIDPIFATTGTTAATLTIRGRNLQNVQAVRFVPGTGITVDVSPSASTDGMIATVRFSVSPLGPTGTHAVIVTTPGGSSDATPTAANTFSVVNQVDAAFTPIISPVVGVVVQSNAPPPGTSFFSPPLGVAVGPVVTSVSPSVGIVGQTTSVTIGGSSLQGVTAVQLSAPDGVTVGAPSVSADGTSVTVSLTIAASAPQTIRAVVVKAGTASVPFASPLASQFRISAPPPALQSVTPNFLQTGAAATTFTIRGVNFQNASAVGFVPPDGIAVNNPPTVDSTGTQITVSASAATTAATGPRAITVTTPGGTSSSVLAAENTVTVTSAIVGTFTPVVSPVVGVTLQDANPPPPAPTGPFVGPAVGVVLQDPNPPPPPATFMASSPVGIAVGPVARSLSASPLFPGASGTLTVSGFALGDVTSVALVPADPNITLGALTIAPDGSQVSVPIAVQATATPGTRWVSVLRGSTPVPFAPTGTNQFGIGVAVPTLDSITPILASRGTTFTMTIRGHNFQGVTAVTATPATGMFIDAAPVAATDGTIITLQIGVAADAPLESKVIQVITPAGASTPDAVPANTFTVEP
ncbi:MAG TPA: RHS repeat domain-containing protein [Burkholderiales bacterium]|nr:RHS repeat domain-containing protein [Burkholderiales bacterium]